MLFNFLPMASFESGYLKEDYINKLEIVDQSINQYTINNTAEKYYKWIKTSLLVDDNSNLHIRFFTPNMITSESELEFYRAIGYIPLTKKYFYKFVSTANYVEEDNYITVDVTIGIYDYVYSRQLAKNYLSNVHVFDTDWVDSLPFKTNITIPFSFMTIRDAEITAGTIDSIFENLMGKMNCILFDDSVIEEKFISNQTLEVFINNKIYNPQNFKYNKLLFAENDKIAKPYRTLISKSDSTETVEFISAITNWILYKDLCYFVDFKGCNYNNFHFISYSSLLPANIKETGIVDGVHNHLSNRNFIWSNFYYNSYNILNSPKLKGAVTSMYDEGISVTNYLDKILHLNYTTETVGNNVNLSLKYGDYSDYQPVKEFIFHDKDGKYKNVMTNWYENNGVAFLNNALPTVTPEILPAGANSTDASDFNTVNVCNKTYLGFTNEDQKINLTIYETPGDYVNDTSQLNGKAPAIQINARENFDANPLYTGPHQYWGQGDITAHKNSVMMISSSSEILWSDTDSKERLTPWTSFWGSPSQWYYNGSSIFQQGNWRSDRHKVHYIFSTTVETNITNDMDEFTMSFNFMAENQDDVDLKLGDYFHVTDKSLRVFDHTLGNITNMVKNHEDYYRYHSGGGKVSEYASRNLKNIYVTIRYYYGEVTVELTDVSLTNTFIFEFPRVSYNFSIDLTERQDIKLSHFTIRFKQNKTTYGTKDIHIGNIDFKNRYVEDFILYDYENGLRESGNGTVIGMY